ncbi:MAG: helix-turn-helix domain-containing protein [Candidatus Omnitrophota bacterium]
MKAFIIKEEPGLSSRRYRDIIRAIEKPLLEEALAEAKGNQLKAAKILGINRNTLRTKIRKLGINIHQLKYEPPINI